MSFMTVAAAAERIGVSPRHLRRLVESGAVPARRVGGSWLIEERALTRRARRASGAGRIWAPRTAWAAVDILGGGSGRDFVDQPRASRLRSRLRTLAPAEVHRLAETRARSHRFHASPRAKEKVKGMVVAAGVTALQRQELARRFGLVALEVDSRVEGYLIGDLVALQSRLRLEPSEEGAVLVRHVPEDVDPSALLGTDPLVALDLMDSDDTRERAAGRDVLERLLKHV